jgi:ATP-dependent helicase HrpA
LNLWAYLKDQQRELSSSAFRRMCRSQHLHYLRVREWQDVHQQLRQAVKALDIALSGAPGEPDRLHRALLSGLLSRIGLKDVTSGDRRGREYLGPRGARFAIWPGSALAKKPPDFVMAAELVETSRLWGRTVARIDPEWAERLGAHLVKRTYSEPHWHAKRGIAMARERVTLYGVPLVADRLVGYGRVDPELSRELFLRHALVEGDWRTHHKFFAANRALLQDAEELEQRARRRDLVVDDEALFAFYDARVPAHVVSARHFDSWWKQARREQPDLLTFTPEMLVRDSAADISEVDYPDRWQVDGHELAVTYQFEPGTAADGVTVHVPLPLLPTLSAEPFTWQIPGLRHDLVTALIRGLPKAVRRTLIPAPDRAAEVLREVGPDDGPMLDVVGAALERLTGTRVDADDWAPDDVPDHLRVTFRVEDERGRALGEGKDLTELQHRLRPQVASAMARAADDIERAGLRSWTVGDLPTSHETVQAGLRVEGYPALVDEGGSVAVRVLPDAAEAEASHMAGVRRLLRLELPSPVPYVLSTLDNSSKLVLSRAWHATATELLDDCIDATLDALVAEFGGPPRDAAGYERLRASVRRRLELALLDVVRSVQRVLAEAHEVQRRLQGIASLVLLPALTDLRGQLDGLIHPGFITEAGTGRLPDLVRYLRAMQVRLDRLPDDPGRDRAALAQVEMARAEYHDALALPLSREPSPELREIRWMLEELRVSLFAPTLRAAYPVSVQRIHKAIVAATA